MRARLCLREPPRRNPLWGSFAMQASALLTVFIVSMVLVLAISKEQKTLRSIMQLSFCYVYFVSIIWMIWCTIDILRFRREWTKITSTDDQADYMGLAKQNRDKVFYFPNSNNTGGLFMRVGAGCEYQFKSNQCTDPLHL